MDDKITEIRRAEVKDTDRLLALLKQVLDVHRNGRPDIFRDSEGKYSKTELTEIISDDERPVFVATDSNDYVLGYCFCIIRQDKNDRILTDIKTLYIDDLCVDEKYRGKNIGRKLYEYAKVYAKSIGCYNLTLNVWSLNTSAMKFYEALGMHPQKIGMEAIL